MISPIIPACKSVSQVVLAAILLYPLHFISGQENYFEKVYTTDDGLVHNSIMSIAQDSSGFLWLGTWDGLSRFDGYDFRNYRHDPNDSTSMPIFSPQQVMVDKFNNVWVFSVPQILGKYNRSSDNFHTIDTASDRLLSKTGIYSCGIGADGVLWIGGKKSICEYDNATGQFRSVKIMDSRNLMAADEEIYKIIIGNDHTVWLITGLQILNATFEPTMNQLTIDLKFPMFLVSNIIVPNGVYHIYQFIRDYNNRPWVVSNYGCLELTMESKQFVLNNSTRPVLSKIGELIWFRSKDSIVTYSSSGVKSVIPVKSDEYLRAFFQDKEGTFWYSIYNSAGVGTGLRARFKTPDYFRHYFTEYDGKSTIVYSVTRDKNNNLLIGTQGNSFIACINENGELRKINQLKPTEAVESSHPRSIIVDSSGILVGYMRNRLDILDARTYHSSNLFLGDGHYSPGRPYSFRILHKDSQGNILVGTVGLHLYTPRSKLKFHEIWNDPHEYNNIYSIISDSAGNVLASSTSRIIKLNKEYSVDTIYSTSRLNYSIEDMCLGKKGILWLALLGGGLQKFDFLSGESSFFTTANGLSNNTCYSILKDSKGRLWISTDDGISRFDPETGKFRIYGFMDGLRIQEFNSEASYMAPDGEMYFGGMGGVVSFYPNVVESESHMYQTKLLITDFTSSGTSRYFKRPVYETDTIHMLKGDNNFGITFSCIDFRYAERIKYRYRLLEQDAQWIETGYLHRRINFAGLHPGKYHLEIESSNITGDWAKHISLVVIIPAFFYQTDLFAVVVFIIILSLAAYLVFIYNSRIRMKEKAKQHYLKLESIRGQMNPHFIFNSLNSINYFIAKSDRISANRYIANFSKLIRAFLNNMAQDYIPLSEEIATISDYLALEYLRFGDKFNYEINTEKVEFIDQWEVFPGMAQPFIENAIWHGVRCLEHKGFIRISFVHTPEEGLYCLISDDGIGRKQSEARKNHINGRKSRGISLVRERLQIINNVQGTSYNLLIDDLQPGIDNCGTLVRIDIPYKNRTFNPHLT